MSIYSYFVFLHSFFLFNLRLEMSYGGNRGSSRRDSYDRRDYYDRNRHGGSYQSKHYGNGGGDRRDSSRRDDRRGGHYNGGRNDNGRSNYGGGGRGPAREGNIESFKLFVVDSSVGPCDFMDYLKSKNLKCFYVDCCAPNEFVFASRNSDEVNGVKKHFTSLSGSIQLPLFVSFILEFNFVLIFFYYSRMIRLNSV